MGSQNYIAFLTVSGFFIGTTFGIVKSDDAGMMLFWPLAITILFYIIAVGVSSFFIGTIEVKKNVYLDTEAFESKYDSLARSLASREKEIKECIDFRAEMAQEDALEFQKKPKKAVVK